ncbi:MAG: isoprenylcysteine carboxylmethyltransferase family protein, partial [Actinomycetia bacterium]|nr:isoprenylcysteine carboxylmethyltransferase family protein [Actinomycetes bacterium]
MTFQSVFSMGAFVALVMIVLIRARLMRRNGIRAIVFGATDKSDFLLVPAVLIIVYTVLARNFSLPFWRPLVRPFWVSTIPGWFGVVFCALAPLGVILILRSFGDSFRVGIDEQQPDKLVTTGLFAYSRNPIYVCFLFFVSGLLLIYGNIAIAVALVAFAAVIHRQILREEVFLKTHYG